LLSGREVDGSVVGGEKMASTAGVLGGSASRLISETGTDSGIGNSGISGGVMVRLIFRRGRPVRAFDVGTAGFSGFSGFSCTKWRCFFGDTIGSVLTGSMDVSVVP
jgi:hypothetical protein